MITTYIKLFLTAVFWGGTFIAGKMIAQTVHPFSASFLRFVIASFFLVLLTLKIHGKLPVPSLKQFGWIVLLGATGVFAYNFFFFTGLGYINAGRASLIIATNPILISFFAAILLKEPLNIIKIAGLLLSVTGAMVVISNGHLSDVIHFNFGTGELLIGGCVLSWVTYSLIGRIVMGGMSPIVAVCYSSMAGTALLAGPAFSAGLSRTIFHYSGLDWLSLFFLGFFGTVLGFWWYYEGIEKIGPAKASVFINFVPVSAIILSFLILKESVSLSLLSGGMMVISGVYFTNASTTLMNWFKKNTTP